MINLKDNLIVAYWLIIIFCHARVILKGFSDPVLLLLYILVSGTNALLLYKCRSILLYWYSQPMSLHFFWPSMHNFLDIELKFSIFITSIVIIIHKI